MIEPTCSNCRYWAEDRRFGIDGWCVSIEVYNLISVADLKTKPEFGCRFYAPKESPARRAAPGRAKGGHARAQALSAERRREIAQAGAAKRWGESL